jgi:hypothetical protein
MAVDNYEDYPHPYALGNEQADEGEYDDEEEPDEEEQAML